MSDAELNVTGAQLLNVRAIDLNDSGYQDAIGVHDGLQAMRYRYTYNLILNYALYFHAKIQ